ncbi:hypothetical protein EON64_03085 [archaeon]|nr:MAG: hypothetical protein EON64_03085 [archaeon]
MSEPFKMRWDLLQEIGQLGHGLRDTHCAFPFQRTGHSGQQMCHTPSVELAFVLPDHCSSLYKKDAKRLRSGKFN